MKLIRHLSLSSLLVTAVAANAGTMGPIVEYAPHTGLYLGAGIGTNMVRYADESGLHQPADSSQGFLGKITGGFDVPFWSRGNLALEVFGDWTTQNEHARLYNPLVTYQLKNPWAYGVALLPGFYFTPNVLGFAHFAAIRSRYEAQGRVIIDDTVVKRFNRGNNIWGAQYGLGVQLPLFHPHLKLRGEYLFTRSAIWPDDTGTQNVRVTDTIGQISLIYQFGAV